MSDAIERHIVDAAERCFESRGVANTTMSHVASEAEVSRTTLYRRFSAMEDVLKAVFAREFDRFAELLEPKLSRITDPADQLVEIVVAIAENVPDNAGLARLVSGPRSRTETMALNAGRSALNQRVEDLIRAPLEALAAEGRLRVDTTTDEKIEWIRRLVNSLAESPQPRKRSPQQRRAYVARFLVPSLCHDGDGALRTPGKQLQAV